MTLEEIINEQNENRIEEGLTGINQLKSNCLEELNVYGISLEDQLNFYIDLVNKVNTHFKSAEEANVFNKRLVLACYELIEEQKKNKNKGE